MLKKTKKRDYFSVAKSGLSVFLILHSKIRFQIIMYTGSEKVLILLKIILLKISKIRVLEE